MKSFLAAVLVAASVKESAAYCLDQYLCVFHQNINSQWFTWDFSGLCASPGYQYFIPAASPAFPTAAPTPNQYWEFNICGTVDTRCNPYIDPTSGKVLYYNTGSAIQYFELNPPSITPSAGASPFTANCEVASRQQDFVSFSLITPGNQNGGVQILTPPVPSGSTDEYTCPPNARGLSQRSVTMNVFCDASVDGIRIIAGNGFIETPPSSCIYITTATSKAACPTTGFTDVYADYRDNPAHSFGFVCLGAFLTIFMYYFIQFGEARSWWDPIKSRMPNMPSWMSGSRGSYGASSSSYKSVSAASGSTATTSISASAYGTT